MPDVTVSTRRGRGTGRAIGIALVALAWILAALLATEIALRVRWSRQARGNPLVQAMDPEMTQVIWGAHASLWAELWMTYRPGASLSLRRGERELTVRINSIGLRSDEVVVPKPPGRYRILCIGGSTTVEGETNETTYPAILERKLNEWWGRDYFEVVNGGICGLNSWTMLPKVDLFASLDPDFVIHYNGINDYMWVILPIWEAAAPEWRRLMSRSELVKTLFPGLLLMDDEYYNNLLAEHTLENRRLTIDRFYELGIPVAIASFATPGVAEASLEERFYLDYNLRDVWGTDYVPYEAYQRRIEQRNAEMRKLCLEKNCLYFPVAESLSLGVDAYFDICHMRQNGIERKADVIASLVKERLLSIGHVPPVGPPVKGTGRTGELSAS